MTPQKRLVELCPINEMRKDEMIASYRNENEKWVQKQIYPYSKFCMERYPDICIGNCEKCKNSKRISEKEYFFKMNDTIINRVKFGIRQFIENLFIGFTLGIPLTLIFTRNIVYVFAIPILFTGVMNLIGVHSFTFNDWLEEKWKQNK